MIVHKLGQEIDTENMNNNHLYTYCIDGYKLYKVEVNFDLKTMENFIEELKIHGIEKEGKVEEIEYDLLTKKPIEKSPYDKIVKILCDPNDFLESKTLLGKNVIKNPYLYWIELPDVYHELKELVKFKTQTDIDKDKDIDLAYYLDKLDNIEDTNLREELLSILKFNIVASIEKNKIEALQNYRDNGFIRMNKQIENANKCLEYGQKNQELIKIFK